MGESGGLAASVLFSVVFSAAFFALVWLLTIRSSKVVDYVGKFLTPVLLLVLAALIGLFHPTGNRT